MIPPPVICPKCKSAMSFERAAGMVVLFCRRCNRTEKVKDEGI